MGRTPFEPHPDEPRGCPTPGACSCLDSINEREALREQLRLHAGDTLSLSNEIAARVEENEALRRERDEALEQATEANNEQFKDRDHYKAQIDELRQDVEELRKALLEFTGTLTAHLESSVGHWRSIPISILDKADRMARAALRTPDAKDQP